MSKKKDMFYVERLVESKTMRSWSVWDKGAATPHEKDVFESALIIMDIDKKVNALQVKISRNISLVIYRNWP